MARKKKEVAKKEEFEIITEVWADEYCETTIPKGATHYKLKVDYSGCYYESDMPSYRMIFSKVKNGD